jgi:hypothetical protein
LTLREHQLHELVRALLLLVLLELGLALPLVAQELQVLPKLCELLVVKLEQLEQLVLQVAPVKLALVQRAPELKPRSLKYLVE